MGVFADRAFKALSRVGLVAMMTGVATAGSGCAARSDAAAREMSSLRDRVAELETARQRDHERLEQVTVRLVALEEVGARAGRGRPELPVVRVRPSRRGAKVVERGVVGDRQREDEPAEDSSRPVLKLHGYGGGYSGGGGGHSGGGGGGRRSVDLAAVNERLPVVPIPDVPGMPELTTTPASLELSEPEPQEPPGIADVIARARPLVRGGDCSGAMRDLAQALVQSPEHPLAAEAMLLRARCMRRQGAALRAIGELERLGRRYPNSGRRAPAMLEMAEAYASLGDAERAQEILAAVVRRFPRSRAATRATARVRELGRGSRAREE